MEWSGPGGMTRDRTDSQMPNGALIGSDGS